MAYEGLSMKLLPAPNVTGNTEAERFDYAVRKMFTVSKKDVLKEETKWERARARSKRAEESGLILTVTALESPDSLIVVAKT
jgi:hypothetical protein